MRYNTYAMDIGQLMGIFLTGLAAGGLSCMAVQGGLLAATIAQREEARLQSQARSGKVLPIVTFLLAKLVAYTILGFFLGLFGSIFQLSLPLQVALQFMVGIFLVGTALNLLHMHPIFRYFMIQPPRFLLRLMRKESKSATLFAPALLGAFTVFIPCGATQAVMAISIASSNPWTGALILFAFTLGTLPVFFVLGYFANKVKDALTQTFAKVVAIALLILAISTINNGVALTGSQLTLESIGMGGWCFISFCDNNASLTANNEPAIMITASGYTPRQLTVQAGASVILHLTNTGSVGCTQAFTIPQLGLQQVVPLGTSQTVHFIAPKNPGQLSFMCSAGLYRGVITVI